MKSKQQNVVRETVHSTSRRHMPAQFGRYRRLMEGDLGGRGLVRVCRSRAELAVCLRRAIYERRQARRDPRQHSPWFVTQEWIGSAFKGVWQDVAARELQTRLRVG